MSLFESLLALLAGIGVFITGMDFMSSSLRRVAGPELKKLLGKMTNNRFAGIGVGASVTAIIQSSSATTVMVVGFVNAGVMTLTQATSIIMGANIGTTVTGLLVSLSSINISLYFSALAFIGVMMMFINKSSIKNIGGIIAGLGLLFIGLSLMSDAFNVEEARNMFTSLFATINFPLLLLFLGMIFTALMQSSSAMTGLIIVMAGQGVMNLEDALFVVLGVNIGTCVTALIATIGTSVNARRTGLIHLLFNVVGTIIFTIFIWIFKNQVVSLLSHINNIQYEIALFHLFFNLVTTCLLLPFIKQLVKIAEIFIKDKEENKENVLKFIDERLLKTPPVAVMQVKKEIENMASLAKQNLSLCFEGVCVYEPKNEKIITKNENQIDSMNSEITKFLIKLSPLVDGESIKTVGSYYHVVNDIERIGDLAENLFDYATEMEEKGLVFSDVAMVEIKTMYSVIMEMYDIATKTFDTDEVVDLKRLSTLEQKTDELKKQFSMAHFERLSQTGCSMELGGYFISIISNLERVGDHLVNIGYSIQNPTGNQPLALKITSD
ncbi:MAG: Na/Pi cotransporter family protein [Bacillales bacterium]|nr:Na/Pi cotransporter family protein [Bacillales bacterium]MDY3890176.1 Na/Pi cotransporter family protein [Bacilli bacterium]